MTDTIESLRQQLAECQASLTAAHEARISAQASGIKLLNQLVECQATNGKLRADMSLFLDSHEECEDFDGFTAQIVSMDDHHKAQEALALPNDATALNELIAERTASLTEELAVARMFADSEDEQMRRQITELTAEVERLKLLEDSALKVCSQLDEIVLAMPYDYLDPPDGGNVSMAEQVCRMYSEVKQLRKQNAELTAQRDAAMKDAERYRWLRSEHAINDPMASVVWKRNYDRKESEWVNTSDVRSLDRAIDAAIANCKEPGKCS